MIRVIINVGVIITDTVCYPPKQNILDHKVEIYYTSNEVGNPKFNVLTQ